MPKRKPRPTGRTVRNDDLTDREMLANIASTIDGSGWATTTDVAIACGFTGDARKNHTPAVKVASRLAYMRDGGLLESTEPDTTRPTFEPGARDKRWRLSPVGTAILNGRLTKPVENALERMDPGQQVLLMRSLTQQGFVNAADSVAFAVRRECMHNLHKRKLKVR